MVPSAREDHPNINPEFQQNILLFVGGLGDGISSVPFIPALSSAVTAVGWSLVEVLLSSSYKGWGVGSIAKDAEELAECVGYFWEGGAGKVVIMGHSTGSQDALEYLCKNTSSRPPVSGVILQASVSDREAATMIMGSRALSDSLAHAKSMISSGSGGEIVSVRDRSPWFVDVPVSARRWWDLLARGGADDYFSSDVSDQVLGETFGRIPGGVGVLFLYSGCDEFVPGEVDKVGLLERWYGACEEAGARVDRDGSGVVEGANHNFGGMAEGVVGDMIGRVVRFLERFVL